MMRFEAGQADGLMRLLLDIGEMLLNSCAEVNRVEDTITRLGKAYGAERMDVFVITSSIVVTMSFPEGLELTRTRRILTTGATDFSRLEALNALSRRCCREPIPLSQLRDELEKLRSDRSGRALFYLGSVLAAGGCAVFFGGTALDGLASALFALLIVAMQQALGDICPNNVVYNLLISFVSGMAICAAGRALPALNADKIMIGDIMLLIPGMIMTNSVRNILVGDTIYGLMRLIESLLWAGALACGFMAAIWLIGG